MTTEILSTLQQVFEENLEEIESMKAAGHKAIGFYCMYSPVEIAVAAKAIPLPLCGTRNDPIAAAEEVLPRNLCPLIKSSYGFGISDTCAFFKASDLIVGDTTCDGKKKMFELLARKKDLHILQLPQNQDLPSSKSLWESEIEEFKTVIEKKTGVLVDDESLSEAIKLLNKERAARQQLMDVNKSNPVLIAGSMMLEVLFKVGFLANKVKGIEFMQKVVKLAEEGAFKTELPQDGSGKRILLTGVPVGLGSDKVVKIIEQCGAHVVAFECCTGYKQAFQIDETKPPMESLAEQYLSTPCSVMSPNQGRFDLLKEMVQEFSADGVIDLTWQACHTYNIEAYQIDEFVQENFGFPTLHLETDYSDSDTEQLRVRVEAYLEMLG